MKRLLSILLVLCIIATLAPVAALADSELSGICGDGLSWSVSEDGTLTISGEGEMYDYSPIETDSGLVTSAPWRELGTEVRSLVVEDGVTDIGTAAFLGCVDLMSVTLSDSVRHIGSRAFESCGNLKSLSLGKGLESIHDRAFYACTKLLALSIPDTVKSIGNYSFFACKSIPAVAVPAAVESLGIYAFAECGMSTAGIAAELKTVPENCFKDCRQLVSVSLPDSIESIGKRAFYGCSSLSIINLPVGLDSIGEYAFYNCSALKSFHVPEGVTEIGKWTFGNCSALKSLSLPAGIESISDRAFYGCESVDDLTVGKSIEDWCEFPKGEDNGSLAEASVSTDRYKSILGYGYSEDGLFWVLDGKGVLTISGKGKMTDYGKQKSADYEWTNAPWGKFASSIKSVILEDGIESIGDCAFYGLERLTDATTYDSLLSVGENAFRGCTRLSNIVLGGKLTEIDKCAFYSCTSLKRISIPSTVTRLGEAVFSYCSSLETAAIPVGVKSIEMWAFYECKSLVNLIIGSSVERIGDSAFSKCEQLTSLVIPDSVSEIATWAFNECKSLKSVDFGVRIKKIGDFAFYSCTSITDISFEGSKAQWESIDLGTYNEALLYAVPHFTKLDPPRPKLSNNATSGRPELTWSAVPGASKYELYRSSERGGEYELLTSTKNLSYTDSSAVLGQVYYYKMRAIAEGGALDSSDLSQPIFGARRCIAPKVTVSNVASTGKIKLTWSAVEGASGYEVYRSGYKNGEYKLQYSTTNLSYTNTGASAGSTYFYKVKAKAAIPESDSVFCSTLTATCDCAAPVVKITLSSGDPKLSWSSVSGAGSYAVYRASSSTGSFSKLGSTTGTSYTDKSASAGKTYYYKLMCISSKTSSANSGYSSVVSIKAK